MRPTARSLAHLVSPWQAMLRTDPAFATIQRIAAGDLVDIDLEAFAARQTAASFRERVGAVMAGNVQIIPVQGMLTQRYSWLTWLMDGTALDWLREAIREAVADPDVSAIVLDVDSPGGSVDGLTEFAADLRALRDQGGKPIVAVSDPMTASAALWAMSQATELVCTISGAVGAVGIVAMHQDISRRLDAEGITITLISSGEFKTEGNPFEPLGEDALRHFQSESQHYYGMFLGDLGKGRGLSPAVVEETYGQGRMIFPQQALAAGMIDRVDTLENTVRRLAKVRAGSARTRAATSHIQLNSLSGLDPEIDALAAEGLDPEAAIEDPADPTDPLAAEEAAPTPITAPDPRWVREHAAAFDRDAHHVAPSRWHD